MLTKAAIDAGMTRLVAGKLTAEDVDKMVGVFRMFFQDLQVKYNYDWKTQLLALDDNADTARTAAQVAACIDAMEALGFGVSSLGSPGLQSGDTASARGSGGSSDGLYYKEKDEYWQYVIIVHTKFYDLPPEFSTYPLARRSGIVHSGPVESVRVERGGLGFSERQSRRRYGTRGTWGQR